MLSGTITLMEWLSFANNTFKFIFLLKIVRAFTNICIQFYSYGISDDVSPIALVDTPNRYFNQ